MREGLLAVAIPHKSGCRRCAALPHNVDRYTEPRYSSTLHRRSTRCPPCFRPGASKPKAPQPSRPCRSTGSAQTGAQFSFFSIPGGPVAQCQRRAGTDRPHTGCGWPVTQQLRAAPCRSPPACRAGSPGRPLRPHRGPIPPLGFSNYESYSGLLWVLTLHVDDAMALSQVERNDFPNVNAIAGLELQQADWLQGSGMHA